MAHPEQRSFCESVRRMFPSYFEDVRVLDVGSLDINGSNRSLFSGGQYVGVDVGEGPGVDVVSKAHEYEAADGSFDVAISTEAFEHDMYFTATLRAMARLVRGFGLMLFTCATTGRDEHGTADHSPGSSPLTAQIPGWDRYYRPLTEEDIRRVLDVEKLFTAYGFDTHAESHDLYFWGLRSTSPLD